MTALSTSPLLGTSFDAVVFDLDGTLIDSHMATIRVYKRWAVEHNVPPGDVPDFLGMPGDAVASSLLPPEVVHAATERMAEMESIDTEDVVALPGALEALEFLPRPRVAIATSCPDTLMRARMQAAGLPFPDVIVTRNQVTHGKPAPDSFLLAAERLGVKPSRILVVEDAPAGIAAARAAGCSVLGIASTKHQDDLAADAVVADLSEITWIIDADDHIAIRPRTP